MMCRRRRFGIIGGIGGEGSGSFLKKRTKKPFSPPNRPANVASPGHVTGGKSFCFFFQKEALAFFISASSSAFSSAPTSATNALTKNHIITPTTAPNGPYVAS